MYDNGRVDARSLECRARGREEREAVETVLEARNLRIIVGARISDDDVLSYFIEVTSHPQEDLRLAYDALLRERGRLEGALRELEYSAFDDDLVRIWERTTPEEDLAIELAHVLRIVADSLLPDPVDPVGE